MLALLHHDEIHFDWRGVTPGAWEGMIPYRPKNRGFLLAFLPVRRLHLSRNPHERYSPYHFVGDLWLLHGAVMGPVADS